MVMTLDNYQDANAHTANKFTFPYNPKTFDDTIDGNQSVITFPYYRHHVVTGGGGINPKSIILTGHLSGSSKLTNYRLLALHFAENQKLKRLFWETDKFYLGVGRQIKQTNSGGRTNFIDYVANFETIIGILFGNTAKTSGTNGGNTTTFIEKITGTVTSGASDITATDATNSWLIPSAVLTTGQAIVVWFVSMVDAGNSIFTSEYNYTTIAGTQTKSIRTTAGSGILQLAPTINVSTITITNLSSKVVTFRDGWIA